MGHSVLSLIRPLRRVQVRKIVRGCKKVLDYLAVTEVIESMDDLTQFVRDISPWLTRVSKDVDLREKELTHVAHREILIRCMDSIKTLAPILICSMKIFIQIHQQGIATKMASQPYSDWEAPKDHRAIEDRISSTFCPLEKVGSIEAGREWRRRERIGTICRSG